MIAAYHTAAIPEPYRILGLRLKAFSLGHYLLLKRFGCAFVSDDLAAYSREDLILGVLICSMPYEEFLAFFQTKDFLKEVKAWGKKCGVFDLKSKARLFHDYIITGSVVPAIWFDDDNSEESGAHWSQAVLTTLTGQVGYTRSEALNAPLTQAFADFYKHAESLGIVQLATPEELEELRIQEAAAAAAAPEEVACGS